MFSFVIAVAVLGNVACGEKMIDWLLSKQTISPELTMTQDLTLKMDINRLKSLTEQSTGGLVMVLPTNLAWLAMPDLYQRLIADNPASAKLRNDVVFAAGGEIDKVGGFDDLLKFADKNDGVVDTAYGTPMKILPDGNACIAEYDTNWNLVTTQCARLRLPPILFEDGSLYLTDNIILPDALLNEAGLLP